VTVDWEVVALGLAMVSMVAMFLRRRTGKAGWAHLATAVMYLETWARKFAAREAAEKKRLESEKSDT
jgi:hypothetical protein